MRIFFEGKEYKYYYIKLVKKRRSPAKPMAELSVIPGPPGSTDRLRETYLY
jgi:hypothetical protein